MVPICGSKVGEACGSKVTEEYGSKVVNERGESFFPPAFQPPKLRCPPARPPTRTASVHPHGWTQPCSLNHCHHPYPSQNFTRLAKYTLDTDAKTYNTYLFTQCMRPHSRLARVRPPGQPHMCPLHRAEFRPRLENEQFSLATKTKTKPKESHTVVTSTIYFSHVPEQPLPERPLGSTFPKQLK